MMYETAGRRRYRNVVVLSLIVIALMVVGYGWSGGQLLPSEVEASAAEQATSPEHIPFTTCDEGCTHSF